ncbi:MAG: hypothetical protein ACPLW9_00390 [Minisyncoccales bacterium]
MPQLSAQTENLLQRFATWRESLKTKEMVSTIHVDEVASKVASFYEKIREIIEWKEEHLMKRVAINRNLKRRILFTNQSKSIAEPLILDLIRGGHFPNDQIPETKINEVEKILDKYIYILNNASSIPENKKLSFSNWLLNIAACEIEEALSSSRKEIFLIDYMTNIMNERIVIQERRVISFGGLTNEEKYIQVFIAVQRALFKLDQPILAYFLLKKKFPTWCQLPSEQLQKITLDILSIWETIEKELNHPLKDKFYQICEKYDTPFLLLGDILTDKIETEINKKFSQPEILEGLIKKAYQQRLNTLKKRLSRAAIYSTLSIFLSKGILVWFTLEIPLAKLITGHFTPLAILVDILGPTLLMFSLVITVRPPAKSNLERVILETMKIVYRNERPEIYELKIPRQRGLIMKFFIALLYLASTALSFGLLIMVLRLVKLPITSYVVNIIFVALIAFAGLAIRNKSEELTVEEKRSGFFGFIFDIIFLPLVNFGHWLSNKWKKYNALAIFFNALIDLPLQLFVEFIEQWRSFLKEEKEKIH